MMNLTKNAQNNQGQAMDRFYGMFDNSVLLDFLDYARNHSIKYTKSGDNYIFYWNYIVDNWTDEENQSLGDYKYVIVIVEKMYSVKKRDMVEYYSVFGTNDDKKSEKFNAFAEAEKLSDENDLKLNTEELEGKIFPSRKERQKMAEDGMYLGQFEK